MQSFVGAFLERFHAELHLQISLFGCRAIWKEKRNWRRAERAPERQLRKVPSARTIVWMMIMARDHLTKADAITVAAIEAGTPMLIEARRLVERFQRRSSSFSPCGFSSVSAVKIVNLIKRSATAGAKSELATWFALPRPSGRARTMVDTGIIEEIRSVLLNAYEAGRAKGREEAMRELQSGVALPAASAIPSVSSNDARPPH